MISAHQPLIFGKDLVTAVSSVDDGDMRFMSAGESAYDNRRRFLSGVGIDPLQATLVPISYGDRRDFTRYSVIDESRQGEGMLSSFDVPPSDAMVVTRPGHALFLLLADCAGVIIHDHANGILMVSHIGRHSVEQMGAAKSIDYLVEQFDSQPHKLNIWISPSVGGRSYPLYAFKGRSLAEVIVEQLLRAGADITRIEVAPVDTAESSDYFSHSRFLAGERLTDGRFAVAAMMDD